MMENIDQNIIDSWVKDFANNEEKHLDKAEMKEEFDAYKNTWDKLKDMQDIEQFDTDKAWNNLYSRIGEEVGEGQIRKVNKLNLTKVMAYAASVIVLIGIAGFMSYNVFFGHATIYNKGTTAQFVELPDGTKVYLNTHSKIKYKKVFYADGKRVVSLEGEAFFDVEKDAEHPFIISAEQSYIKVLGTSFNVSTKNNDVEVVVKTGKVEVYNKNESIEHVILLPGDKATLNNVDEIQKTENKNDNYLSWLNRKLVFKAMALNEVVNDLEGTYNANIELDDPAMDSLLFTSTFDDDSLEDILQSIALTFNLNIVKEGKKYTLVTN